MGSELNIVITLSVTLVFAILFLLSGLWLLFVGERSPDTHGRVIVHLYKFKINVPYQAGIISATLGVCLLFMAHSLVKSPQDLERIEKGAVSSFKISILSKAYAQDRAQTDTPTAGWVYFGYEKNSDLWNFSFVLGNYKEMLQDPSAVKLQAKYLLNVREKQYGNFTGTFLNFIDPVPKKVGELAKGECIIVQQVKSVGFSKIWLNYRLAQC